MSQQEAANPEATGERQLAPSSMSPGAHGAVFLDRDGVINENAYVNRPEDLVLIPGSAEAIARLNRAGIRVFVVTNQGGVAMGHLTEETLAEIHKHLHELLAEQGAHLDGIDYCPHMSSARVAEYRLDCPARKPGTGMLERARDAHGIDLSESVLVGDATTDLLAGETAGCRTILVRTGFGGKDGKAEVRPTVEAADLAAAVDMILSA